MLIGWFDFELIEPWISLTMRIALGQIIIFNNASHNTQNVRHAEHETHLYTYEQPFNFSQGYKQSK